MRGHLLSGLSLSHQEKNNCCGSGKGFFIFSSHVGEHRNSCSRYSHADRSVGARKECEENGPAKVCSSQTDTDGGKS